MKKILLDKMEFPYNFIKEININIYLLKINRYTTNGILNNFKKKIYNFFNINDKYIILGNGSDELIFFIISCYKKYKFNFVGSFYPCFYMYEFYSKSCNVPFIKFNLNKKYSFNQYKISDFLIKKKCGIFFISYPNNPTGKIFDIKKILFLIRKCKRTLFVIDEAYYFYSNKTLLKFKFKNVVILRTFSKIGFSSLRLGFMICNKNNYLYFVNKKSPYNVNIFAIKLISFFIKNFDFYKKKFEKVKKQKKIVLKKLKINSESNFFLIKNKKGLLKMFKKYNILIKKIYYNSNKYLRISIGKKENNYKVIKIINEIHKKEKNKRN
ncbi:aminotransferase class I/II-fold pyridoxal phosphate-dependent enzyme [Candidatus Vidania fulgoroideorum]